MYEGPPVASEDMYSVYVILNGSLGMSNGKLCAMSFHCGVMTGRLLSPRLGVTLTKTEQWKAQGGRVRVRIAQTEAVFKRVCAEVPGALLQDEGMTEVEHGAHVAWVTPPLLPSQEPRALNHKKVRAL